MHLACLSVLALTLGLVACATANDDTIKSQVESNWNVSPRGDDCVGHTVGPIDVRIDLEPDGTVTKVEPLNLTPGDKCALAEYEKAKRAVMIASPLQLPAGKVYDTMRLRFYPDQVMQ